MADPVSKGSRALRYPRRIVQLNDDDAVVLEEFPSSAVSGKAVHEALLKHARAHPGAVIAAQWLGPMGWTRFLTITPESNAAQAEALGNNQEATGAPAAGSRSSKETSRTKAPASEGKSKAQP